MTETATQTTELPTDIDVRIELVTPEMAQEWLDEHNIHNRRIRPNQVRNLAQDMTSGNWLFTGDPVRFDWTGTLLDGQHRLSAIVQTGLSEPLLIIRGLDPAAQAAMDIQSRRQAYDALRLRGVEGDMKNAAAIARGVIMYDTQRVPTHLETVAFVQEHAEDLADASVVSEMVRRTGKLTGGAFYGIAFYLLARIDRQAAYDFFEKLASGVELEKGSPILLLGKQLSRGLPFGFGRGAWHLRQNLSIVFYCWNAWREGKELNAFRMPKGEMPEPK